MQAIDERQLLYSRKRSFHGALSGIHLDWLHAHVVKFSLEDDSKALRMVLDYVMQDLPESEFFSSGGVALSRPPSSTQGLERTFILDVCHTTWLEKMKEKAKERSGVEDEALLLDLAIGWARKVDDVIVFEIERAQRRPRDNGLRFSIKS